MDETLSATESLALSDAVPERDLEDQFFSRGLELERADGSEDSAAPTAADDVRPEEPRSPRWLVALTVCLLLAVLSVGLFEALPGLFHSMDGRLPLEPPSATQSSAVILTR